MVLNIVMVEPEIPQNTGNVARTCAATGARLHLVGPMGFKLDDRKLKRAGLDYWHLLDITYYDSLDEFFAKNQGEFFFFSTKSVHKHTDVVYPDNCYLFFGKETAGLPEELLFHNKERCVRIPMLSEARRYASLVLERDPELASKENQPLLRELRRDGRAIKDFSKIS